MSKCRRPELVSDNRIGNEKFRFFLLYMTVETVFVDGAEILVPCDMPDDLQRGIIECAKIAASKFDVDRNGASAAEYIKKHLDEELEPHWHVVIGNNFGSYVVHDQMRFIYFKLNSRCYLIYKSGNGARPSYN